MNGDGAMTTATDMASGYEPPELKKVLSARVRLASHAKIVQVVELWREKARLDGKSKQEIEAINASHVVDRLLAIRLDEELQQWGGYASTDEAKAAQLKALRDAHKKHSK
jgi:hypothetical protein